MRTVCKKPEATTFYTLEDRPQPVRNPGNLQFNVSVDDGWEANVICGRSSETLQFSLFNKICKHVKINPALLPV